MVLYDEPDINTLKINLNPSAFPRAGAAIVGEEHADKALDR